MPATIEGSAGTDKYTSFEEKRWPIRVVLCKETTSPPPESRPQYEWHFAVEGAQDYETGAELVRRVWCSQTWGEIPEKESHLVIMARALCGPNVTRDQFEALDYPDLVGLRATAMVMLDSKGWPTIDKLSMKSVGNAAPRNQAPLPQATAPAQTQLPNKPTRPAFLPPSNLRTEEQVAELLGRAAVNDPPLSAGEVDAWVAQSYPGTTIATLTREQADDLIDALLPF